MRLPVFLPLLFYIFRYARKDMRDLTLDCRLYWPDDERRFGVLVRHAICRTRRLVDSVEFGDYRK